jgi:hypothetical protein
MVAKSSLPDEARPTLDKLSAKMFNSILKPVVGSTRKWWSAQ